MDAEGWTAIIPLKPAAERKTRLAPSLSPPERERLSEAMFDRAVAALQGAPAVRRIVLLSVERMRWDGDWIEDRRRGLNAELQAARAALNIRRLIVIHADLPLLGAPDVDAVIGAAEGGCAIAPDRHRAGTNALALTTPADFMFRFGAASFRLHLQMAGDRAGIVQRPGLALDIDTKDDLALAVAAGFSW